MQRSPALACLACALTLVGGACFDDPIDNPSTSEAGTSSGDGDGDPSGDGDGDPTTTAGDECGDGIIDAGEDCDDGGASATCDADCTLAMCGDGTWNMIADEACDDGNEDNSDACVMCQLATCGDGFVFEGEEQCDDGNDNEEDDCDNDCQPTTDPQCQEPYAELSLSTRNHLTGGMVPACDRVGSPDQSSDWGGPRWYRFTGPAGTTMPTESPGPESCGTDAPGWLNGELPAKADGVVDRQVCFDFFQPCSYDADIQVVNCGTFYLFYLPDAPQCLLRYCGA